MLSPTYLILISLAVIVLFMGWYTTVWLFKRTKELGSTHNYNFVDFFDAVVRSFIFSAIIARFGWIITHISDVILIGFGILPYERIGRQFEWLTVYPWRFFRFNEGFLWYLLWPVFGFFFIALFILPLVRLIRGLNVDKDSVKLHLYIRHFLYILIVVLYFSLLTYISL